MNTPTVIASVLLACGGAAAITVYGRSTEGSLPNPELAAAKTEVATLREQVARLESRLEEVAAIPLARSSAPERVQVPTISNEQIAGAVEAYLNERGASGAIPASIGDEPLTLDALYADLMGTSFWDNSEAWKKAFEEGRMDELIAKFEADAEAFPNDADKQMALAGAYISYLQLDQSKWPLSMKADEAYDRVLAIDERHWEARFSKAVSYTFWPDFLGKKSDAISHFEILVEQQESSPVNANDFQTYLYLGNLLEAKDPKRAREIWQRGATRHPDNAELRQKLGQ